VKSPSVPPRVQHFQIDEEHDGRQNHVGIY
jgi:hypothetical protein